MNFQLILLLAVTVVIATGCSFDFGAWVRSTDDFVIEEGGMIIYNPPRGYQELDLDAGTTRDVFDGSAGDLHGPYRTGWRRDVIWRSSRTDFSFLDVVSPYSGTVERCGLVDEKDRWFSRVYGSISDDTVLVRLRTKKEAGDELHVCFFNTFTGEVEEFWKSEDLAVPLSISPYGDIVTFGVRPKDQPYDPDIKFNQEVWVYDCRQKKLTKITENLKLPPDVMQYVRFRDVQVSPVTGIVLLPTTRRFKKDGRSLRKETLWVYDPRTKEAHKIEIGTMDNVGLPKGCTFAPDGKRAIVEDAPGSCVIYDTSTQIIAPVPNTPTINNSACWSPSGRYIAHYGYAGTDMSGCVYLDMRICEVISGKDMKVADTNHEPCRQISWLALLVSRKEANINYLKWLISLLERGVETDKAVKRLQEITGKNIGPVHTDWQQWLAENEQFLLWSEKDQKFTPVQDAKNANIPLEVWEIMPSEKRAGWSSLNDTERDGLRTNAEKRLTARRDIEKAAWKAGVAPKVWVLIPEDKQAKWAELEEKERIRQVAEAKKKYLKQKASGENSPPIPVRVRVEGSVCEGRMNSDR